MDVQLTPLESFIRHKAQTGMQCGNYSIDVPPLAPDEQYRFHFDATACVGCHCCEAACNEQNGNPPSVKWRRVGEMEGGVFPQTTQLFNSMSCNHCIDPACLNGCPTVSYIKLDNGIVVHDDDTCIGCQYCTWNCPYEVPVFNKERGIVTKCHMCHDKLAAGQTPACVQACPAGAIMIETVNTKQWLDGAMQREGVAPHLPDPAITKPTTRYTLPDLPRTLRPADERHLTPAHPEWPLVFMTVLTQLSVGGMAALLLGSLVALTGSPLPAPGFAEALAVLIPAAVGLPLSALHLGRPVLALTAMKNLRTSWLSREAAALGLYTLLATLVVLLAFFGRSPAMIAAVCATALGTGLYGIYAQSMIYRIKARPSWDRPATNRRFFATGYLGALLMATLLTQTAHAAGAVPLLVLALLGAFYQMITVYEETAFYRRLDESHPLFWQLDRSRKLLLERFGALTATRLAALGFFALLLPLAAVVLISAGTGREAALVVSVAFIGAFASEIAGRYLFYVTVVPLGLAGNFHAGNQRS